MGGQRTEAEVEAEAVAAQRREMRPIQRLLLLLWHEGSSMAGWLVASQEKATTHPRGGRRRTYVTAAPEAGSAEEQRRPAGWRHGPDDPAAAFQCDCDIVSPAGGKLDLRERSITSAAHAQWHTDAGGRQSCTVHVPPPGPSIRR